MVQEVLGEMRKRIQIPLETICTSGLAVMLSCGPALSKQVTVPFEVCGHVYANPPRQVYAIVSFVSFLTLTNSVLSAIVRCLVIWRRGDKEDRMAHLVPCVGTEVHNDLCALYPRRWRLPPSIGCNLIFVAFALWLFGDKIPSIRVALGFIVAYQALNMYLAIVMIVTVKRKSSTIHKFIDMLSVFVTDREYDAPDFEKELCPYEEVSDATSNCIAEIVYTAQAVIDIGNGNLLSIRNDKDVGSLGADVSWRGWSSLALPRMPKGKLIRIEKKYLNFMLIPLRIPYSVMWYSIYKALKLVGGYRGAEDIDKCIIWLAMVSVLTAILISYIPGPSVVIKTANTTENKSYVADWTIDSQIEE